MEEKLNEVKQKAKDGLDFAKLIANATIEAGWEHKEFVLLSWLTIYVVLHDLDVTNRLNHLEYDFTHIPMDKLINVKVKEVE